MGKPAKGDPNVSTRWAWSKQTPDGILSSGDLSADKVKHAWQLKNSYDPRHYIVMDADGRRKGRTSLEAPGGLGLKVGQDCSREEATQTVASDIASGNNALSIQVENGNLNIDCQNGDLNIIARNINFKIADKDNEGGNFTVNATKKISLISKGNTFLHGAVHCVVSSNNMLRCMGDIKLELISGICLATSDSSRKGTKPDLYKSDDFIPGRYTKKRSQNPGVRKQTGEYNYQDPAKKIRGIDGR
tara:strand:- start:530 stop:1264 length:735 start_codon:yes stop_codon:yes gene_type:complete